MHEPGRGGGSAAAPLPAARLRSSSPSLLLGLPGLEVSRAGREPGREGARESKMAHTQLPAFWGYPFLPHTQQICPKPTLNIPQRPNPWVDPCGAGSSTVQLCHPAQQRIFSFSSVLLVLGAAACSAGCLLPVFPSPSATAGAGHQRSSSEPMPGPVSQRICRGAGTGTPVVLRTPPSTGSSLGQMSGCL